MAGQASGADGDAILIEGLLVPAPVGVTADERRMRRPVRIDLELGTSLARAGASDRLADTVDYGAVVAAVEEVVRAREHQLVEALAERIVADLFERFPVERITIRVRKLAPLAAPVEHTGVRIERRRPARAAAR